MSTASGASPGSAKCSIEAAPSCSQWLERTIGPFYLAHKGGTQGTRPSCQGSGSPVALTIGDRTERKDGLISNPAVRARVVCVLGPDDPQNGPQEVLSDFPGPTACSPWKVENNQSLESVLAQRRLVLVGIAKNICSCRFQDF